MDTILTATGARQAYPAPAESDSSAAGWQETIDGSGRRPESLEREPENRQELLPISELLDRYLSSKPDYDFDLLSRELAQSDSREHAVSPQDIARRWRMIGRYMADALDIGHNVREDAEGGWQLGRALLGSAVGSTFGHAGSTGETSGYGPLRTLQGLEEGFRRLHS